MSKRAISFQPAGEDLYDVQFNEHMTDVTSKSTVEQLSDILQKEPYNLSAALELADRYMDKEMYEEACEVRFRAATVAIEALPEEDDYFEIDCNNPDNISFVEVIAESGRDFYIYGEFETAAALLETALMIDSEDHFEIFPYLILSYIAIEEWEEYEYLAGTLQPNSFLEAFVENFAAYVQKRESRISIPPAIIDALNGVEYNTTDRRLVEATEFVQSHMSLFEVFNDFTEKIRNIK